MGRDDFPFRTGFDSLDDAIGPLGRDDLIVIAGRPASGYRLLMLSMLWRHRMYNRACYITMETTADQIRRHLFYMTELDSDDIFHTARQTGKLVYLEGVDQDRKHVILGYRYPKVLTLMELITAIYREINPDFFVIDELQDIKGYDEPMLGKSKRNNKLLRQLKLLARTMNRPIFLLSRLSPFADTNKFRRNGPHYYMRKVQYVDCLMIPIRWSYYGLHHDEFDEDVEPDQTTIFTYRPGGCPNLSQFARSDLQFEFTQRRFEEMTDVVDRGGFVQF